MKLTDTIDALCTDLIAAERRQALKACKATAKIVREAERARAVRIIQDNKGNIGAALAAILDEEIK